MVGAVYSVIVPVHNEASLLHETVPTVLAAIGTLDVELVYVCNGCTDESADIISAIGRDRVKVLSIPVKNKLAALRAGETQVSAFPRVFLDADCLVPSNAFTEIVKALENGCTELISSALADEAAAASRTSKMIADVWCQIAQSRTTSFQVCLAVSAEGRNRWGEWPSGQLLFADDAFVVVSIPPDKRRVLRSVTVRTYAPGTFLGWVRTRSRWYRANANINAVGRSVEHDAHRFGRLYKQFLRRPFPVGVYAMSVLLGRLLSLALTQTEWRNFRTKI